MPSATTATPCPCCSLPNALQCRWIGGTATLCGFSEYTSPSSPPKKYLVKTLSGSSIGNAYTDASCATLNCQTILTYTGASTYSSTTCGITDTGLDTRTGTCPGSVTPVSSISIFAAGGDSFVLTPTTRTITNNLACYGIGGGQSFRRPSVPTSTETLGTEDTDANAIARLLAASSFTSWTTAGAAGCTGMPPSCCVAGYEERTSGFSFSYRDAEFRVTATGLAPSTGYTADVLIYRRAYGSGSYALYQTITVTGTSDGSGNLTTAAAGVPNDEGFETYAHSSSLYPV